MKKKNDYSQIHQLIGFSMCENASLFALVGTMTCEISFFICHCIIEPELKKKYTQFLLNICVNPIREL